MLNNFPFKPYRCIHHPRCHNLPVCYPVPSFNRQLCPLIATMNTTTASTITTTMSTTTTTQQLSMNTTTASTITTTMPTTTTTQQLFPLYAILLCH
ncbi:unnamed protein product [Rotaria sordida]|uniref:Uncharacterized protein n=1 Tax=Rotaria sordida TaxID=392033 RepID=A0A815CP13_9BILA|nr:unnamed protein product [Rotaria sordida]